MLRRIGIAVWAAAALVVAGFSTPAGAKEFIAFTGDYEPGTIIIVNSERKLYYVLGEGRAIRYPVAVGKPGDLWIGESVVTRKVTHPGWSPTPAMRRRNPRLPQYVPPGPRNPLGVRAMYLGWTYYLIHGTNSPWSIGRAASSGCIRMHNEHVVDLYERVHLGAPVMVVNSLNAVVSQQ
jgi:lipoprotein-anchoring transpeptidase ErfK/SrfK